MSSQRSTQGGQVFTTSGEPFQWGDWLQFQERYSLAKQSIDNGAVEITKRTMAIPEAQTMLYYAFDVTPNRRILEFTRTLDFIGAGRYQIDLVTASGGFEGGTPAFKLKLSEAPVGASETVTSEILTDVTPIGDLTVVAELRTISAAAVGQPSRAGASASDNVLKGITSPGVLLRVQRIDGAGTWTSTFNGVFWEEDR